MINVRMVFLVVLMCSSSALAADGYNLRTVKGTFDSALFELNNAIINRGLVVDYTGHVDHMLTRTSGATNSKSPYKHAKYIQFCSAKLTHAAVKANPKNLAICPYVVFAYELSSKPGTIYVGYRKPIADTTAASKDALGKIKKLLDTITKDATK